MWILEALLPSLLNIELASISTWTPMNPSFIKCIFHYENQNVFYWLLMFWILRTLRLLVVYFIKIHLASHYLRRLSNKNRKKYVLIDWVLLFGANSVNWPSASGFPAKFTKWPNVSFLFPPNWLLRVCNFKSCSQSDLHSRLTRFLFNSFFSNLPNLLQIVAFRIVFRRLVSAFKIKRWNWNHTRHTVWNIPRLKILQTLTRE